MVPWIIIEINICEHNSSFMELFIWKFKIKYTDIGFAHEVGQKFIQDMNQNLYVLLTKDMFIAWNTFAVQIINLIMCKEKDRRT